MLPAELSASNIFYVLPDFIWVGYQRGERVRKKSFQFGPEGRGGNSRGDYSLDGQFAGGSPGVWSIVVPGSPDALPHVRRMVTQAATRCGFAPEEIAKIEMAVDEACTNIIEHAYHALREHHLPEQAEIEVHAHEHPDRLEITILDHSLQDFPVLDHAPECMDEYFSEQKKRGMGLFIIRSFVDDVKHRFVDGRGNELLLVKYFA